MLAVVSGNGGMRSDDQGKSSVLQAAIVHSTNLGDVPSYKEKVRGPPELSAKYDDDGITPTTPRRLVQTKREDNAEEHGITFNNQVNGPTEGGKPKNAPILQSMEDRELNVDDSDHPD